MQKIYRFTTFLAILLFQGAFNANASHLVGGEITYIYLSDSSAGTNIYHRYKITLALYEDCKNGQPQAIAEDNPAFLAVYAAGSNALVRDDSIDFDSSVSIPSTILGPCPSTYAPVCLIKKTFKKIYAVPAGSGGYIISYQRCCRNGAITNIANPSDNGATFTCYLPATPNNSAVFKTYPPQVLQVGTPFSADLSATDPDGDSLSYELCGALLGADNTNIKPYPPTGPPFDTVSYLPSYSSGKPLAATSRFSLDPAIGTVSGTPDVTGRYLVTLCCHEWRGGVMINTVRREFQVIVAEPIGPYKPDAGPDVELTVGDTFQFHAANALTYLWTPATYLDDPSISDPIGHFTEAGTFFYILHGTYRNSLGSCEGNDTLRVIVDDHSGVVLPAAFTPNGDGKNDILYALPVGKSTIVRLKIFNRKGNRVFDGGPSDYWDGSYQGIVQDLGTYYWVVEYIDNTGKSRRAKGDVTLVK